VIGLVGVQKSLATISTITAGDRFTCAATLLKVSFDSPSLDCWGSNASGISDIPLALLEDGSYGLGEFIGGSTHVCLFLTGGITCWGNPELAKVPEAFTVVNSAAASASSTCVLYNTNDAPYQVGCWGEAESFPLANTNTSSYAIAGSVSGPHFCAISQKWGEDSVITAMCWGCDDTSAEVCQPPSTHFRMRYLAVGRRHACAVRITDDAVECWGDNSLGQLDVPSAINGSAITALNAGDDYTCVLESHSPSNPDSMYTTNGTLTCWGSGASGTLNFPPFIQGHVLGVSTGATHACAMYEKLNFGYPSNLGVCWGSNADGEVSPLPDFVTSFASSAAAFTRASFVSTAAAAIIVCVALMI